MSSPSADSYIGSLISLTSKHEIRYEGIIYYLNPQDSTFGLKNVRSFGTEGRKKDGPQILPSDKVYEYILFRGSDIKDLEVKSSPAAQLEETLHDDPAIIQSHCNGGLSTSSKSFPVGGPSAGSGASHGISGNNALQHPSQYANSAFLAVPNLFQTSSNQTLTSPSNFVVPESRGSPFNLPHSSYNNSNTIKDLFCSTSSLPSASVESALPSYPAMFVGPGSEVSSISKAGPGSVSFLPVQSPYPVSSVNSSLSLLNHPPTPITPDQISQPRASELLPPPMFFIDQGDVGAASSASSNSSLSITSPADQPPLLPLPPHAQKLHYSPAINEEFDFEAMNEKFKKDELWGYLGRSKQSGERVDDSYDAGQKIGEDSLAEKVEAKPAYKKDDFFDSISCNSLSRGANNGHRFSERRKLDIETFGAYQQRIHPNVVAYGTRHGHYNRGTGHHHYGVRGRGRYNRT